MNFPCQACNHMGMEFPMWEICPKCRWENDNSLQDEKENFISVSSILSEVERDLWSSANGDSANGWMRKQVWK